ncbi:uncharacterized protein LOC141511849 [Macrotis lagotis]|uniref:uncharacterized protein LOC141511849 n=1 Tax=Macrotis lagotis TaxID=92651 RepID=UPI003D695D78
MTAGRAGVCGLPGRRGGVLRAPRARACACAEGPGAGVREGRPPLRRRPAFPRGRAGGKGGERGGAPHPGGRTSTEALPLSEGPSASSPLTIEAVQLPRRLPGLPAARGQAGEPNAPARPLPASPPNSPRACALTRFSAPTGRLGENVPVGAPEPRRERRPRQSRYWRPSGHRQLPRKHPCKTLQTPKGAEMPERTLVPRRQSE